MNDIAMSAIHAALGNLSLRQTAISDNVSNVQTPGYKAKVVSFESSLKKALSGESNTVSPSISISPNASNINGNNVSLDSETLSLVETNLRYQTMIEAMNAKFRVLRTAIGGGA